MKIIVALTFLITIIRGEIPEHLVKSLPDQPALTSKWYSGMLNGTHEKQFHYVFIESTGNSSTDPIIIFFDGGPGIAMVGIFAGIGPLLNTGQVPFIANPYTWNDKSNVMFISNPSGVGFSYAPKQEDLYNNDNSVSNDLFAVIQNFFRGFPEYLSNPLYIGGHSYGGIYAPFLAF